MSLVGSASSPCPNGHCISAKNSKICTCRSKWGAAPVCKMSFSTQNEPVVFGNGCYVT